MNHTKNRTTGHVPSNNGLYLRSAAQYVLLLLVLAVNSEFYRVTRSYSSHLFLCTLDEIHVADTCNCNEQVCSKEVKNFFVNTFHKTAGRTIYQGESFPLLFLQNGASSSCEVAAVLWEVQRHSLWQQWCPPHDIASLCAPGSCNGS